MIKTTNRILVIGDIHGGLKAINQVFERAKVTTDDRLIFLGDYVDGWSESPQVLDFLIELYTLSKILSLFCSILNTGYTHI